MGEKEGIKGFGITVKADEAPQSFRVEARVENSGQFGGSNAPVSVGPTSSEMKKKRGKPRKFSPDGSVVALSPMPISASFPFSGDYSAWNHSGGMQFDSFKKEPKLEFGSAGQTLTYPGAESFTPHLIIVNAGEDVMTKIMSFSQQRSRAICILAATGYISNVTLHQPNSSTGTLTYEGRFAILSLTGSFSPSDNEPTKSRSGGMSVSLAGHDGRIVGGGLAGILVAASPVQIVLGSFVPGQQHEHTPKKPKCEQTATFAPVSGNPEVKIEPTDSAPKPNLTMRTSFHGDDLAHVNSIHSTKIADVENCILMPGEESIDQSHEITC